MNRQRIINEGQEAQRILGDETIKNVLDEIEAESIEAWTEATDPVDQGKMWWAVWSVRKFRQKLIEKIDAGETEKVLEQVEQDAEKAKERDV